MTDPTPCTVTLRAEWETCDHLSRFETWATLYQRRFGRLCPGRDDPLRDSSDPENRAQCDDWHTSGLAKQDAVMALARAWERIEQLERQLEDMTP